MFFTNIFKDCFFSILFFIPLIANASISDNELRQLFIISGVQPNTLNNKNYGGTVLFKGYFTENKTACSLKQQQPNLTVFIDQEGGTVVRLPHASPPSPLEAKKMSENLFYHAVKESAKKLKIACIDANLAPVVDISRFSGDTRSYGSNLKDVVFNASIFSKAMQSEGIRTVIKHFPGWHNNCIAITDLQHINMTIKKGSEALECHLHSEFDNVIENLMAFNKVPSDAWMVGNNIYTELGPYPSSMNPEIKEIIREKMHYQGLLISDALWEIEASPKAILMALKVNDWVMVGYPQQVEITLPILQAAIKNGIFSEVEIRDKLNKISHFKNKL